MGVRIGKVDGSETRWRVVVDGPAVVGGAAVFHRPSRREAEALASQLAGGRRDRITWQDWPADVAAPTFALAPEPEAEPPASTGLLLTLAELTEQAAVLVGQSSGPIATALDSGAWDDALDEVEAAERARQRGARKTVLRAIEARRALGE